MSAADLLDLFGGPDTQAIAPVWYRVACFGAVLALCLAIGVIDARHRIIPNGLNAALAVLGLASAGFGGRDALLAAGFQGVVAFALFWAFQSLYRRIRGVEGLGFGDVKFLGAAGIWVGLGGIAPVVLVSCFAALGFVGIKHLSGTKMTARSALPFGPFLAFGLVVVLAVGFFWP